MGAPCRSSQDTSCREQGPLSAKREQGLLSAKWRRQKGTAGLTDRDGALACALACALALRHPGPVLSRRQQWPDLRPVLGAFHTSLGQCWGPGPGFASVCLLRAGTPGRKSCWVSVLQARAGEATQFN